MRILEGREACLIYFHPWHSLNVFQIALTVSGGSRHKPDFDL